VFKWKGSIARLCPQTYDPNQVSGHVMMLLLIRFPRVR
jgi:hypothetical protein